MLWSDYARVHRKRKVKFPVWNGMADMYRLMDGENYGNDGFVAMEWVVRERKWEGNTF